MRFRALGLGLSLSLLFSLALGRSAQAQELDGRARPRDGTVQVVISGVPDFVKLRVADAESGQTVVECRGRCVFATQPGRYRVYTFNPDTDERHELGLSVRRAGRFRLEAGDDTARNWGLVLGIAGPALILTGSLLLLPALAGSSCPDSSSCSDHNTSGLVGLSMILGGAILTPIGWTVFAGNRSKLTSVDADRDAASTSRWRLGVAGVGPGAFGLASAVSF